MEKIIEDLPAFVSELSAAFPDYEFNFQWQGCDNRILRPWARVFVQQCEPGDSTPYSLGRVNFQPLRDGGWRIYGCKMYKPSDLPYESCDAFFYQFDAWVKTGRRVEIDHLVQKAIEVKRQKIEAAKAWRASHPIARKRARLSDNWMGEFRRLVDNVVGIEAKGL